MTALTPHLHQEAHKIAWDNVGGVINDIINQWEQDNPTWLDDGDRTPRPTDEDIRSIVMETWRQRCPAYGARPEFIDTMHQAIDEYLEHLKITS